MKVEKITLDNGLTILLEKIPASKLTALGFGIKCGHVDENQDEYGIAHIAEHLFFKSTKNRTAEQIKQEIEWGGGEGDAFTSNDRIGLIFTANPERLTRFLRLGHEMLMNKKYQEEEFAKEKSVIINELQQDKNDCLTYLLESFNTHFFKGTSYETPVGGTEETVSNIKLEQIVDFKDRFYVPNNLVIACSGSFDGGIVRGIENTFGNLTSKTIERKQIISPTRPKEKGYLKLHKKDLVCASFAIGHLISGDLNEDEIKMKFIGALLGRGMSSRLFQLLREKYGMVYEVGSGYNLESDHGLFYTILPGIAQQDLGVAETLILKEYEKVKTTVIPKKEFVGVKEHILFKRRKSIQEVDGRVNFLIDAYFKGTTLNIHEFERELQNLTREDVMEAARKYLTDKYMVATLTPKNGK